MKEFQRWHFAMQEKIKEGVHLRVLSTNLKNFCNGILEQEDTRFDLIYSGSRMQYKGVIFRGEIGSGTLSYILKNYGKQLFFKVKRDKRI